MQPMIAIFTPLRCSVAALIRAVVVWRLKSVRPQRWTGDIIGLENPRPRRLQNVVAQAQRLARRFFALHENRVADAIAKERADVRGRSRSVVQKISARRSGAIVRRSFSRIGCARDRSFAASKRNAVITGRSTSSLTVTSCVSRIVQPQWPHHRADRLPLLRLFVNDLRLVIAHAVDLVRDLFEVAPCERRRAPVSSPPHATPSALQFDLVVPALIGKWIEGKWESLVRLSCDGSGVGCF